MRARLVAAVVGAQLLLAAGLVWAGVAFTRRQLRQAFDATLEGRARGLAAVVHYAESGSGLVFDPGQARAGVEAGALYRVTGPKGAVLGGTLPPAGAARREASSDGGYWNFAEGGAGYRGVVVGRLPVLDSEEDVPGPPARLTVAYAAPTAGMDHEAAVAGWAIAASSLGLLLLTSWYAAWRIGREMEPVRELARQAAAISPRQWRLATTPTMAVSELRPLIAAMETMLARLQEAQRQQLAFLADTAHHLRTPVAIIKATQQTLLQRPREGAEYRAAAAATLQDTERLHQLLQRMLRLAHLDAAEMEAHTPAARSKIGATLWSALDHVQPLAESLGVRLCAHDLDLAQTGVAVAAEDLELAWVNLLENAIQHSPAHAAVDVWCERSGGALAVSVRDHGGGIAPEQLPHIFERFWRGPESRGFGLGLPIARGIIEAAGGRLEVETSSGGTLMRAAWANQDLG